MRRPTFFLLVCFCLLIIGVRPSFGQKQFNTWYFGNNVGLDFNNTPPTVLRDGKVVTGEGSACVSDPTTGAILFYTEGMNLFNRKHEVMPNGGGLLSHPSSTQAALIAHDPANRNRYYVFTTAFYPSGSFSGISYSIVDMTADNGFGDVVEKNVSLLDGTAEKLTAIGSRDESFYWIIGQSMNSNRYHAWKLTADGLDRNAVISSVGTVIGTDHTETIGWLTPSPAGTMLAAANWGRSQLELYKFNFETGKITDPITLPSLPGAYGAAFSADESKVYCGADGFVYQFDVSTYTRAAIELSKQEINHAGTLTVSVKLGPDDNIYVRIAEFVGRITNANSSMFNFEPRAFSLGFADPAIGFPNDPVLIGAAPPKPRILSASLTTLDFGALNLCEERDSVVVLTNTGEVPVTITDAFIDKNFRIVNLSLPVTLQAGETLEIAIETIADPINQPAVLSGLLTIRSDAMNALRPIMLTRGMLYPVELRLEARDDASAGFGEDVTFDLVLSGDIPPNVTAVHFDLLHNNDLLSFTGMNAPGLTLGVTQGVTEQRQSFTLTSKQAGVIGNLTFRTFLASANSTTLRFENVRLDNTGLPLPAECIALFSDSSASFTYTNTCGDPIIRDYLTLDAIMLSSVSPNPAREWIAIDLETKLPKIEAHASLIDALGREVLQVPVMSRSTHIDVSDVPAGTYYLRISMDDHVRSHRVLIHR